MVSAAAAASILLSCQLVFDLLVGDAHPFTAAMQGPCRDLISPLFAVRLRGPSVCGGAVTCWCHWKEAVCSCLMLVHDAAGLLRSVLCRQMLQGPYADSSQQWYKQGEPPGPCC